MQAIFPFTIEWDDLDANLHVANVRYNVFATNARVAFLLHAGYRFDPDATFGPVVLTDTVSYRKELRMGDKGTVELQLLGLSPDQGRWKVRQIITKETGDISATVDSFGGWLNLKTRKLAVPSGEFVEKFALLDRSPEFEILRSLRV